MKLRNKKGDISITILVLGVVAVCVLAIVSFFISKGTAQGSFTSPAVFENISSQIESFHIYVNSGMSYQQAANEIGAQLDGNKLVLNAEQGGISVIYPMKINGN